jgi:hypothetical protein
LTAYCLNFGPREVLIAGDTLIYTANNEPLGFIDKVTPLPRMRAAFFSRGAHVIGVSALATLALRYDVQTFEAAAAALPAILAEVTEDAAAKYDIEDPDGLILFEGRFVGWSEAEKRMRLYQYDNYDGYRQNGDENPVGWKACPPLEPEHIPPGLKAQTPERICIEILKAHRRAFAARLGHDKLPVGGEITLTRVTERSVDTRIIHRFEDAAEHGHAAAAVAARIARGDAPAIDLNEALTPVENGIRINGGPTAPGVSRAERRRAEKMARKTAKRAA